MSPQKCNNKVEEGVCEFTESIKVLWWGNFPTLRSDRYDDTKPLGRHQRWTPSQTPIFLLILVNSLWDSSFILKFLFPHKNFDFNTNNY